MIKKRKFNDLTDKNMKEFYNYCFFWWIKWFTITEYWR
jgi:hypothetical protein